MTFTQSIRTCLSKYATFKGRASRSEYWWFVLFLIPIQAIADGLDLFIERSAEYHIVTLSPFTERAVAIGALLAGLLLLAMIVPYVAVGVRRLHDTEHSGWWLLPMILLAPIVSYVGDANVESQLIESIGLIGLLIIWINIAIVLCWNVRKGTSETNKYGEPLGEDGKPQPLTTIIEI